MSHYHNTIFLPPFYERQPITKASELRKVFHSRASQRFPGYLLKPYHTNVSINDLERYAKQYADKPWRYRLDLAFKNQYAIQSTRAILDWFLSRVSQYSTDKRTAYHYVLEWGDKREALHAHMLLNTDVATDQLSAIWMQYGDVHILALSTATNRITAIRYALSRELEYSYIDSMENTTFLEDLVSKRHNKRMRDYNKQETPHECTTNHTRISQGLEYQHSSLVSIEG